mmetsp:Transcript_37760/g.75245  ORF Transcript_37760/g.75245 Transcript_37760/m.75245 type:complete len:168 (-) Transcript_37760:126-629(-)
MSPVESSTYILRKHRPTKLMGKKKIANEITAVVVNVDHIKPLSFHDGVRKTNAATVSAAGPKALMRFTEKSAMLQFAGLSGLLYTRSKAYLPTAYCTTIPTKPRSETIGITGAKKRQQKVVFNASAKRLGASISLGSKAFLLNHSICPVTCLSSCASGGVFGCGAHR